MAEINEATTGKQSAQLLVRINQIDYTLVPPGNLDNSSLPRVPVLRIFGSSSTGKTACVHVHQVYPYFFVEYSGKLSPGHVKDYISKLLRSLNHAVALSLKKNPHSPKSQFIRAILLVKGVNFYGFHASYAPFLKILVADPAYVTRIVTILQSGSVMGKRFSVYESHLSYILQFLSDFGLYGCGLIELEEVFERCGEEPESEEPPSSTRPHFRVSSYFRESRLPLEVDVIAPHILNRHRLVARNLHHRLEIPAPSLPPEPLVLSVRELWEDERTHRQALGLNPSPEIPIDPSESSRGAGGDWVAEARWWDEIRQRIDNGRDQQKPISIETQHGWQHLVMTTFESVEAIWDKQYKTWKPSKKEGSVDLMPADKSDQNLRHQDYAWDDQTQTRSDTNEKDEQIEVDISLLSNQEIILLDQEEALDLNKEALHDAPGVEENEDDAEDNSYEEEQGIDGDLEDTSAAVDKNTPRESSPLDPFLEYSEGSQHETVQYRLESPPSPPRRSIEERDGSPTPTKIHSVPLMAVTEGLAGQSEEVLADVDVGDALDITPTQFNRPLSDFRNTRAMHATQDSPSLQTNGNPDDSRQLDISGQQPKNLPATAVILGAKERTSLITARAVQLSRAFDTCKATNTNRYLYSLQPPTSLELQIGLQHLGISSMIYSAPYYSNDFDVPENSKEYAGLTYRLKGGRGIATLDEWSTDPPNDSNRISDQTSSLNSTGVGGWEYASHPPSMKQVRQEMIRSHSGHFKEKLRSQIEGPTQANIYGFKTSPTTAMSAIRERARLSVMSVEVFVPTNDVKVPNAASDEVVAIFYAHHISGMEITNTGVLVVQNSQINQHRSRQTKIESFETELDLLNRLVDLVFELDPDILTGWEIQLSSWGYIDARSNTYGLTFSELISRAPPRPSGGSAVDQWGLRKTSTFKVAGRHVFNLWRIMRSERTLTVYAFENVVFDVLRRRVPKYSYKTLTGWYHSPVPTHVSLLLQHFLGRVARNLELLEETETITKTAEFARVFGVDFFSVLSRGSQFKVESFMFRIAKPESFVLISPSRTDVGKQNAAECMPLIMEPASAFYSSPLLVLDFQSLYPSIMIAYNYCYSTCLGRINDFQGAYKFGVVDDLEIPSELLEKLQDHINVAPNGIMYVKSNVRRGLLGRMLVELLDTRVMVKQAMKRVAGDKARKRILDARQLSLKYIANVTYGYTSATFSGRMPAVEIADSIVQSGRETLEKAIDVIDSTTKWGAKVVYGDTDSVFVYLPGKTKDQAFAIGNDIAKTITALNPVPIKLKFEKVYLPCVLMAKKRYVGFKFEKIDDTEPVFDAKGIETVRRDGVLAQRKMVENCLKILFRTQDLSEVKDYCCRSWTKLLDNKASVQDFIFAKEVRMGTYSDKVPPPPGVVVAARRMVLDPNDEPQYGDRIPYVIVRSTSGARLVDRAMDPLEFVNNSQLRLDALYYITRVLIPPLERIFNLVGADVKQWFNEMPKTVMPELVSPRKPKTVPASSSPDKININEHFLSTQCLSCGGSASQSLCDSCCLSTEETIVNLGFRIRTKEERLANAHRVCSTCTGSTPSDPIDCESLDCPWFYARRKAETAMELVPLFAELIEDVTISALREDSRENEEEMPIYERENSVLDELDIYVVDEMEE